MTWQDLVTGIAEEFACAQQRFVNATAIIASACATRRARLADYRAKWRAANPEKHRAANRAAARAFYARNREPLKAKARRDYLRRCAAKRRAA